MKTCKVITKHSYNGEYIHTIIGDMFCSNGYEVNEQTGEASCIYHCSKSSARKALAGYKHHDLISIN